MSRDWPRKLRISQLQGKFLALVVPLFLIIAVVFVSVFEVTVYREKDLELQKRLDQFAQTFGVVLARPLWSVDIEQIETIMEAIAADKDFAGAAVYDDDGNVVAEIGRVTGSPLPSLSTRLIVTTRPEIDTDIRDIGELYIAFTNKNLLAASYRRVAIEVTLAVILVLVLVATSIFVHRKLIGTPLQRLMAVIQLSPGESRGKRVDWDSDDEIGMVTTAFNQMLQNHEIDQDELEARVEDRTLHLEQQITEREYAEASLRRSEERFRDMVEIGSDFIWEMDSDLRFTFVTDKFFEISGKKSADVIGKRRMEIVSQQELQDHPDKWRRHRQDLDERRPFTNLEMSIKAMTGGLLYLSISGKPVFNDDGLFDGYRGIARDVTKEVLAAMALRENEARLLQILNNSPFGVSIVSIANKKRLFVNPRFTKMFSGSSTVDLLSHNLAETYVNPGDLENHWSALEQAGYISGAEERRRRLDGTEWWCLAEWRRVSFENEDAAMVWHFDITERKRAEEELNAQTELVDLLRVTASDANMATNFDDAMRTCLNTVNRYTGWPVGHVYLLSDEDDNVLVPSSIWHLDNPKRFNVFVEATNKTTFERGIGLPGRVLESGKPAWIVDVTKDPNFPRAKLAKDIGVRGGFAFPVLAGDDVVAVLEFFDEKADEPDETLLAAVAHIGNQLGLVFERKRAETELRHAMEEIDEANRSLEKKVKARTRELHGAKDEAEAAKQEAETANETKSEFLANMSHELRTPLNAIIGFSEIIKGAMFGPLENKYQDYANDINASGEHLLGIIADILDLSKVETGELDIEEEEVDVVEAVAACKMMEGSRAEQAAVTLTTDMAADLPPLHADPLRLKQILLNLISNAIKFTPKGGKITVTGGTNGNGGVVLAVEDTGVGIARGDISKVLEKFGQVRDRHTHAHEGAGLGLVISKSLMELHDGKLEIESEVGKGTTVTVTFPPQRTIKPPGHRSAKG